MNTKLAKKKKQEYLNGIWTGIGMIFTGLGYWAAEKFFFGEFWKEYPKMGKIIYWGFMSIAILGLVIAFLFWIAYQKVCKEIEEENKSKEQSTN